MDLRLPAVSTLIAGLILLPPTHASPAPGVELNEAELSGAFAAGLDLDVTAAARHHDAATSPESKRQPHDSGSRSDSARDLARSLEDQLPWSQKQVASTAVQATVRTTQAMATVTQMLPFGLIFLPTVGLPLVPPNTQNKSSGNR